MFSISGKKQHSEKAKDGLEYVVIKRGTGQNSFMLCPPKWINNYFNGYIWDYAVVDVIYELLKGIPFAAEVRFEQYWELLSDIKGYQTLDMKKDSNDVYSKVIFSNGGVKKDILVEMMKGMDIWSYDGILKLYGVGSEISVGNNLDAALLDNFKVTIEPCNDGSDLLIRIGERFITVQQFYEKLTDIFSIYGIRLEGGLL